MVYDGKRERQVLAIQKMSEESGKHSIAYEVDRCFQQDWELIIGGKKVHAGDLICYDNNPEFAVSCELFESSPFNRSDGDIPIGTLVFNRHDCKSGYVLLPQEVENNNPTVTLRGEALKPISFAAAQQAFGRV